MSMPRDNMPEAGLGEEGSHGKAAAILFDHKQTAMETEDIPGFAFCCAYGDTEICGRCGAC